MKIINITFDDKEFKELNSLKIKTKLTWRKFFLDKFGVKND